MKSFGLWQLFPMLDFCSDVTKVHHICTRQDVCVRVCAKGCNLKAFNDMWDLPHQVGVG